MVVKNFLFFGPLLEKKNSGDPLIDSFPRVSHFIVTKG